MKNKGKFITGRSMEKRICFAIGDAELEAIDRAAHATHVSRSFLMREVIIGWLKTSGVIEHE
jgi:hypothetical protein